MGVTDKAVSKWERDLSFPDINSIPKLAEIFEVTVDELMQVKTETKENMEKNKIEVKTYELNEIEPKDEKDIKIDFLMAQIEELKKGIRKNESNDYVNEPITNTNESEEPSNVSNVSKSSKKSK